MIELLLQAERALAVGLVDHAERLYRQAIAADPRNSIAVVGLARVALERADDAEAYRRARQALTIDPENVAALRLTGRLEEVYAHRGETLPGVDDARAISAPASSAPVMAQAGPPVASIAAGAPVAPTGHLTAEPAVEPAAPAIAPPAPAIEPAAAQATPAIPVIQAAPAIQPPVAAPVPAAAVPAAAVPAAAVPAAGAALEPAATPAVTPPPTEAPTAQVKAPPVRTPAPAPGPPPPVHRSFLDRLLRRNRP